MKTNQYRTKQMSQRKTTRNTSSGTPTFTHTENPIKTEVESIMSKPNICKVKKNAQAQHCETKKL